MEQKAKDLKDLTDLDSHIKTLQAELPRFVGGCRAEGASWEEIGRAMGITKQAAQQKYARFCKTEQLGCPSCEWTVAYPNWDFAGAQDDYWAHMEEHEREIEYPTVQTRTGPVELGPEDFGEFWAADPGPETAAGAAVAAIVPTPGEPQQTKLDMLNALGPSDTTRKFYETALKNGLEPEVEFNAETCHLTIVVKGPEPSRGWVMMSQLPGAGSRPRHYYSYASMRTFAPKRVTHYEATRVVREWSAR